MKFHCALGIYHYASLGQWKNRVVCLLKDVEQLYGQLP